MKFLLGVACGLAVAAYYRGQIVTYQDWVIADLSFQHDLLQLLNGEVDEEEATVQRP